MDKPAAYLTAKLAEANGYGIELMDSYEDMAAYILKELADWLQAVHAEWPPEDQCRWAAQYVGQLLTEGL